MERQMSAQLCIFSEHENSYATDHDRKIDSLSSNSTQARSDPAMTGGKVQTINRLSTQFMSCNDHFYAETNWRSELNNFTFIKYFWWLVPAAAPCDDTPIMETNICSTTSTTNSKYLSYLSIIISTQRNSLMRNTRIDSTQLNCCTPLFCSALSPHFFVHCGFHWIFIEHEYQH